MQNAQRKNGETERFFVNVPKSIYAGKKPLISKKSHDIVRVQTSWATSLETAKETPVRTEDAHTGGPHGDSTGGHLKQTAKRTSQVTAERTAKATEAMRQKDGNGMTRRKTQKGRAVSKNCPAFLVHRNAVKTDIGIGLQRESNMEEL